MKQKIDKMNLDKDTMFWGNHYERFVEWHPTLKCPDCGDKMFCDHSGKKEQDKEWFCHSALYLEGGC